MVTSRLRHVSVDHPQSDSSRWYSMKWYTLATKHDESAAMNCMGRPLRKVAYSGRRVKTIVVKGKLSFQSTPVCEISSI